MTPCDLGAGGPCRGAAWICPFISRFVSYFHDITHDILEACTEASWSIQMEEDSDFGSSKAKKRVSFAEPRPGSTWQLPKRSSLFWFVSISRSRYQLSGEPCVSDFLVDPKLSPGNQLPPGAHGHPLLMSCAVPLGMRCKCAKTLQKTLVKEKHTETNLKTVLTSNSLKCLSRLTCSCQPKMRTKLGIWHNSSLNSREAQRAPGVNSMWNNNIKTIQKSMKHI